MKHKWITVVLAVLLLTGTSIVSADKPGTELFVSSIVMNQTNLRWWDALNLTITYPNEAARQSHQPRYPNMPNVQINCYQNGLLVMRELFVVQDKTRIDGGWIGLTNTFWLRGTREQHPWSDTLPGQCSLWLFYYDSKAVCHVLATADFSVAPIN